MGAKVINGIEIEIKNLGWPVNVSDEKQTLTPDIIEQGRKAIEEWKRYFPREKTWVQEKYGIPSLIVRLDCVTVNGKLMVYEVEERPACIGVAYKINPQFARRFNRLRESWPDVEVVISPKRERQDDCLWTKTVSIDEISPGSVVLVRAEPEEKEFHSLKSRSISSIVEKGNKSYGVGMGLWREAKFFEFDNLPWNKNFVLKPTQGSKCRGMEFWNLKKKKGYSTKTRIARKLKQEDKMYLQEFIEPEVYNGMYRIQRVFYAFNPVQKKWVCLGGCWTAMKNLRVHGTPESVFGPLTCEG